MMLWAERQNRIASAQELDDLPAIIRCPGLLQDAVCRDDYTINTGARKKIGRRKQHLQNADPVGLCQGRGLY